MNILYQIVISPIESIIEYIFCFSVENFKVLGVPGTLFLVSLVVNFLALPLYNIADKQQLKEREIQNKLSYRVERIKKGFKGDEQFMILSEYYRQNGYHPLYALRSALSILIEIPFFIAAYHFLSNCTYLNGVSLGFIRDLGNPDKIYTLNLGTLVFSINILPIIMTVVNLVSSVVYTRGARLREKVQTFVLALIFLVLLYDSPAGLVVYWISNNVFSLVKNVIMTSELYKKRENEKVIKPKDEQFIPTNVGIFLSGAIVLFALAGIYIPSNAIVSSPIDFALVGEVKSPLEFILHNGVFYFGLFVFWPFVIYNLFGDKVKHAMETIFAIIAFEALANVFIFKHAYGTINNNFGLDKPEYISDTSVFLAIGPIVLLIILIVAKRCIDKTGKEGILIYVFVIVVLAESVVSFSNIKSIKSEYEGFLAETGINPDAKPTLEPDDLDMTLFHLSKTDNNVIVLFMDRALSNYFPYVLEQFPELKEIYDGFTYYPNCISFSDWTSCAGPAMFGGYEYTVDSMDERDDVLLKDKFNEAQRVMPKIFSEAGYDVSMVNIPFPNFNEGDDPLSYVFGELENNGVKAFDMPYKFEKRFQVEHAEDLVSKEDRKISIAERNFSAMQMMLPIFRNRFSNESKYYYDINNYTALMTFMEARYAQLLYLPEAFAYDGDKPTFTFIANDMPHDFTELREDYSFGTIDASHPAAGTGTVEQAKGPYHVNVASYLLISKLLEALKENDVYDNTKIVIISDHGYAVDVPVFKSFENSSDAASFNPLFLVKDFGATGEPKVDNTFTTNAELVNIVRDGLDISDTNPYTGKAFTNVNDYDSFNVYRMDNWWTEDYQKEFKYPIKDKVAYNVKNNIFDEQNWNRIDTSNME